MLLDIDKAKEKLDYSKLLWQNGGKVLGITLLAVLAFFVYTRYVTIPFIAEEKISDIFALLWKLIASFVLTIAIICIVCIKSIRNGVRRTVSEQVVQNDMETAARIQKSMLPRLEKDNIYSDVSTALIPAATVGGDLYYWLRNGDNACFCIGDVSGKGVPAALFMARSISLFRTIAKANCSPTVIAEKMNEDLAFNNDYNMFVTMFIGVYDINTKILSYCNAGHNSPLVWNGKKGEKAYFFEESDNLPLGIDSGIPFTAHSVKLNDDGVMMLYTDGVTEATDNKNNCYGEERLLELFEAHKSETSDEINSALLNDIKNFVGTAMQSDDITILTTQSKQEYKNH